MQNYNDTMQALNDYDVSSMAPSAVSKRKERLVKTVAKITELQAREKFLLSEIEQVRQDLRKQQERKEDAEEVAHITALAKKFKEQLEMATQRNKNFAETMKSQQQIERAKTNYIRTALDIKNKQQSVALIKSKQQQLIAQNQ